MSEEEKEFMDQQSMEYIKSKRELIEQKEREKDKEIEPIKETIHEVQSKNNIDAHSPKIQPESEMLKPDKISPRCYLSDKIEMENFKHIEEVEHVVSSKRKSKDPTIMQSTENLLDNSLGFSHLNVEEDKFIGNTKNQSKMKEISSDSESEDDETMLSQFNKSYLTRNSDYGEKKSKIESTQVISKRDVSNKEKAALKSDNNIISQSKQSKKSLLDLTINKNINKSLKHTINFREKPLEMISESKKEVKKSNSDEDEKVLLQTEPVKTNDLPNMSGLQFSNNNKNNSSNNMSNKLTHSSLKPNTVSNTSSPGIVQKKKPKVEKQTFTSIEVNKTPISFGIQNKKSEKVKKLKQKLGGQMPKFEEESPNDEILENERFQNSRIFRIC